MRRESKSERAAWTEYIEGKQFTPVSKYGSVRCEMNGRVYPSKHQAKIAATLQMLQERGLISDLKEEVPIILVPGDGKLRPITYRADFTYRDERSLHVVDAKGFKHPVYRLKKRLAALLLGIQIEEV